MGECVKVIVRCRPINQREKNLNCKTVISMDTPKGQCSITNPHDEKAPPKMFTFDGAYFVDSTTEQIYNEIAYPLVEVRSVCIFFLVFESMYLYLLLLFTQET